MTTLRKHLRHLIGQRNEARRRILSAEKTLAKAKRAEFQAGTEVAKAIAAIHTEMKINQCSFAKKCGITQGMVSNLKRGKFRLTDEALNKMLKALNP